MSSPHPDHHVIIDLSPAPHTLEVRLSGAGLFSVDMPTSDEPITDQQLRTWLTDVLSEHLDYVVGHLATAYRDAVDTPFDEPPF
ncbi:hypothetical protein [Nocardia miyunensis]|uniref:hypothetical protein n=1 Tax=Nocardia miyunensis TaxID=282684 RepID=UPI000AA0B708|nr:hypothetical protein [Nocardia miyunensis]